MENNENLCTICLSDISNCSENELYTLPCNHTFHTKCIMEWFRISNGNCPLCNDNPNTTTTIDEFSFSFNTGELVNERCKLIKRRYKNNKQCPKLLKNSIHKLEELESELKENGKNRREFLNKDIVKQFKSELKELNNKIYKSNSKIRKQKYKIVTMVPGLILSM